MKNWQPSASIENLKLRAQCLQEIRRFFAERDVMEVDTQLLSRGVATDPAIGAFSVLCSDGQLRFLQTSPEYAMKRLIAAGSGPIYYLGKAFRNGEVGSRHNPEFTMLEWYRPGWDHLQLISEVDALFQTLFDTEPAQVKTYQSLFETYFQIHPHLADIKTLQNIAIEKNWVWGQELPTLDKDGWLDLLMSHGIEPHLTQDYPTVIVDYPASQAALAKTRIVREGKDTFEVAERFEFFYRGVELTNGYHELTCALEQKERFLIDLSIRQERGLETLPIDQKLLDALAAGFPPCAGVAIGFDRLLMLKLKESKIERVIPFCWEHA